jgi:hypothetical protein
MATTVAATSALVVTAAAPALATDPPGNNGTVKVDDQPLDSIPNNDPHVGCEFRIDFYGFDEGDYSATVTLALHEPTLTEHTLDVVSGDLNPFIGEDPAGGGTDLDASEAYVLELTGPPHAQQGYHVKLTVNAPGSIGNDTKYKVFWVETCPPTEEPTPEPTVTPEPEDGMGGGEPTETPVPVPTEIPAGTDSAGVGTAGTAGLVAVIAAFAAGAAVIIRRRFLTES